MASWAVMTEQVVWISPRATGFTVVCDRCADVGETFPSVQATLYHMGEEVLVRRRRAAET